MHNIYDLFNERKNGINMLVEGAGAEEDEIVEEEYDLEDIEAFESIEEALETLDEVLTESNNELIELRAAQYLENLVLENMMYDDFDEEKIGGLLEAAEGGKKEAFMKRINDLWNKIKAWFAATAKSISNYFIGGEKLVAQNESKIGPAMRLCDAKVKINDWKDMKGALNGLHGLINKLKGGREQSNDAALKAIGAKDAKDVENIVRKLFMGAEAKEMKVSDINVEVAKAYAGGKSALLGNLETLKNEFNKQFAEILNLLKTEKADEKEITTFNYKISLQSKAMSAAIKCARKACSDYTAVIRKALTSKLPKEEGEEKPKKEEKPKEEKEKKEKKSFSFKDKFGKKDKNKEKEEK